MSGKMDNGHGGFKTAQDGKPYTTLLYADGPGFSVDTQGHRADITNVDTSKTWTFCVNNFLWSYLLTFDMFERFFGFVSFVVWLWTQFA